MTSMYGVLTVNPDGVVNFPGISLDTSLATVDVSLRKILHCVLSKIN